MTVKYIPPEVGYAETSSATLAAMHIQEAPPMNLFVRAWLWREKLPTPYNGRRTSRCEWKLEC